MNKWNLENNCNEDCSENCAVEGGCRDNGYCHLKDGKLIVSCKTNFWGPRCDKKCNDGKTKFCKGNCENHGVNHMTKGVCTSCEVGYWGKECN